MMTEFLQQILAFPTVIYTTLLCVVLLYWGFVIFGALDIDMFDAADGLAEGAAEGVAEGAAEGLAEGAAEGLAEGAAEGLAEGAAEGLAEGVAEGAAEGVAEGVAEGAAEGGAEGLAESLSLASFIGLRKAPVTLIISLLVLGGWAFCYLGMQYLAPVLDGVMPHWLSSAVVFVLAFVAAMPVTGITARPFAPLLKTHKAERRRDLVGRTCRIETGTVDGKFGQATIEEDGGWMKVDVRCERVNSLSRGDEALVIAYDPVHEVFKVEPLSTPPDTRRTAQTQARRDGAT